MTFNATHVMFSGLYSQNITNEEHDVLLYSLNRVFVTSISFNDVLLSMITLKDKYLTII